VTLAVLSCSSTKCLGEEGPCQVGLCARFVAVGPVSATIAHVFLDGVRSEPDVGAGRYLWANPRHVDFTFYIVVFS
jgi:hypothetical protein